MKRVAIISRNREPSFKNENTIYLQITEKHTVENLIKVAQRMQVDEIVIDNKTQENMDYKIESAIKITWIIAEYIHKGNLSCISLLNKELKEFIAALAERFESIHSDSNWYELDYRKEIFEFTKKAIIKESWKRFGRSEKKIYAYDFFEGNKGVVFAINEELAREKVIYIYGTEYCAAHKLTIKEADMWDLDVYCTVDIWN